MPKVSGKNEKTVYQTIRDNLGLSRDKASELLGSIPPERIERIESGKFAAHPDEIVIMADKYKAPYLCNHYCANECEIGKQYVPEIEVKDLSRIVLEMLSSLNSVRKKQERLIEIAADSKIDESEVEDFVDIQTELEHISITVESLQLWAEQMLANGYIDRNIYETVKKKKAL